MNTFTFATPLDLGGGVEGSSSNNVIVFLDNGGTSNTRMVFEGYREWGRVPHFTVDPSGFEVFQHLDVDVGSLWTLPLNRYGKVVSVVVAKAAWQRLGCDLEHYVAEQVLLIANRLGVVLDLRIEGVRLGELASWSGVMDAGAIGAGREGLGLFGWDVFSSVAAEPVVSGEPAPEPVFEVEPEVVPPVVEEVEDVPAPAGEITHEESMLDVPGLGDFPGRAVSLGSGGRAVDQLRVWLDLGEGNFDEELQAELEALLGDEWDGVVSGEVWDQLLGME